MNKKILIAALLLMSQSFHAYADEVYKCVTDGQTTYQSKPCKTDDFNQQNDSTVFDGWTFGLTIDQIKNMARDRQLPMVPHVGIITQKFNDNVLNSKPESREYTYKTRIMDKLTTVTLYFTKTTQKLYKIKSTFHVIQLKPEERKYFYESIYSTLSKKYGTAKNADAEIIKSDNPLQNILTQGVTNTLIGTLLEWGSDTDNVVTLNHKKNYETMLSYELTYKNMPLLSQNDIETT
jgi:hypothetical protein